MIVELFDMKKYALIGHPLGHSLSPLIHSELLRKSSVKGKYELFDIEVEKLSSEYNKKLKGLDGFNVTIPHKVNIIPFLDRLSGRANIFGSVNTVDISDGISTGYNTDCTGFLRALDMADIELGGKVMVCGCGGVSRTFLFESALAEADLTLAVRKKSLKKAEALNAELESKLSRKAKIITLDEACGGYDLIINGTPVGMTPYTDASPVSKEAVQGSGAVFDAVYNPEETLLIKYAAEAGIRYSNGLSMLVWQAAAAQTIWNGSEFTNRDISDIMSLCEKELSNNE